MSEVTEVKGYVGNFDVTVVKKARYVDEKECTACGDCARVCPVVYPDEFNVGLSSRKAVYIPFPQSVPSSYVINMNECMGRGCSKCLDACEKKLHQFSYVRRGNHRKGRFHCGGQRASEPYDPREMDEYGYTWFQNSS